MTPRSTSQNCLYSVFTPLFKAQAIYCERREGKKRKISHTAKKIKSEIILKQIQTKLAILENLFKLALGSCLPWKICFHFLSNSKNNSFQEIIQVYFLQQNLNSTGNNQDSYQKFNKTLTPCQSTINTEFTHTQSSNGERWAHTLCRKSSEF